MLQAMGTGLFLATLLAVVALLGITVVRLARRQWGRAGRALGMLALLVAAYLALVAAVSLIRPRLERARGAPVCFDEWCVAATGAALAARPAGCLARSPVWLIGLEVSSRAKRVTQRELAAVAEVEDGAGRRYAPCGPAVSERGRVPTLWDPVAPGASFSLTLPFALPPGATPAGVVIRHPYTPGALIVGDDEALFHSPTLLRLTP